MINFDREISSKKLNKFNQRTSERNKNVKKHSHILKAWDAALNRGNPELEIVHSISSRGSVSAIGKRSQNSPFLMRSVESLLSSWDIISACCLLGAKVFPHGVVLGMAPLDIHLNLSVPVQNILGTHLRDVCFNNFAGLDGNVPDGQLIDKGLLAKSIFNGIERPNKHGFKMNEPYNILRHPHQFLNRMLNGIGSYNEILIVGKPGLRMYMNLPCTDLVRLKGISFLPNYFSKILASGSFNELTMSKFNEDLEFIKKLLMVNSLNKFTFSLGRLPVVKRLNFSEHIENAGFRKQTDFTYILD